MAVYTYEIATDIIIPNIIVEREYMDGVHTAYRITPAEGYVLHDPERDNEVFDPMTGDTVTEKYYYRSAGIPARYDPSTWTWEAVLESEVPADSIFGGGDNDHEVM